MKQLTLTDVSIPSAPEDWLAMLDEPTAIHLGPRSANKTRIIVTLIHGNEPSGLLAIHQLLTEHYQPNCHLVIIIASVHAALREPIFTHRYLPNHADLNRCFGTPDTNTRVGRLAQQIVDYIRPLKPEAVVDLHNTSGNGPDFGVAVTSDQDTLALVSVFTSRMVFTELKVGALMELDFGCPIATIECGGSRNPHSHQVAKEGIQKFGEIDSIYCLDAQVDVVRQPKRLELVPGTPLELGLHLSSGKEFVLNRHIERQNFGVTPPGYQVGWSRMLADYPVQLRDAGEDEALLDYFSLEQDTLTTKVPMMIFMATTQTQIAQSDCLFYFSTDIH